MDRAGDELKGVQILTRFRTGTRRPLSGDTATLVAHLQGRLEDERARVARRLHGDVAGMLAAARMELSRIAGNVADDRELQGQLAQVDQILEQVIQNARSEMQRLHPALLDHFGLPAALRHTVEERCRATGAEFALDLPELTDGVSAPAALAAYRFIELMLDGKSVRRVRVRLRETAAGHQLLAEVEGAGAREAGPTADLLALRAWLESTGATWSEKQRGEVESVELTIPRESPATATGGGLPG